MPVCYHTDSGGKFHEALDAARSGEYDCLGGL